VQKAQIRWEKRLNERNARNGHVPLHQNLKLAGHWHGFWTFLLLIAAANFGGTWLTSFATAEKLVGVAMNKFFPGNVSLFPFFRKGMSSAFWILALFNFFITAD
jgi:hypothetical protein